MRQDLPPHLGFPFLYFQLLAYAVIAVEEKVKKYLLDIIPDKVRALKERHRECAEKYRSYWDTMPDRFARMFEKDPGETLEKFLSLRDEECAWREADFITRDLYLDNFIARELARELKKELDAMEVPEKELAEAAGPGEDSPAPEDVQGLLKENIRLKKAVEDLVRKIEECDREKEELRAELSKQKKAAKKTESKKAAEERRELELRVANAEGRLKMLKKDIDRLEMYSKGLEERLQRCLMRREARKLMRMAGILRVGLRIGMLTPALAADEVGINLDTTYDYIRELREIGMLKRARRGHYVLVGEIKEEGLEEEIALRLARKKEEATGSRGR
jgi:hypothetical protein